MSEQAFTQPDRARSGRRKLYAIGALVACLGLFAWTIVSRAMTRTALREQTIATATPTVATIRPQHGPADEELVLPGTVQAHNEAPIYARTSGYLKIWYTDIGAHVARGQVLAEIDSPEVDQELRQAEADLATAQANYELAKTTNQRWQGLLATESVSKQDAEQKSGAALFRMSDTKKLRIYVQVPQPYAPAAVPGVIGQLRFAEHPGKSYPT